MESEEKLIISFIFKRTGKEKMTPSEIYLSISMDLNWCKPDLAKKFVEIAIDKNLLTEEKNYLKATFDIDKISIPTGYKPSEKFFEKKIREHNGEKEGNVLIKKIAKKANKDIEATKQKIQKIAEEKNITFKIAALMMGKKYDLVLDDFSKEAEEEIFK